MMKGKNGPNLEVNKTSWKRTYLNAIAFDGKSGSVHKRKGAHFLPQLVEEITSN